MATPDKQYVAFHGEPDGYLLLVDNRPPSGQVQTVLRQHGDLTDGVIDLGDVIPPNGWDGQDALKVSGVENYIIKAKTVKGGSEDVVDVNHSHGVIIDIELALPTGTYVSTIKGGSTGISLNVKVQHGHGSEVDYDLGNYSQQSKAKTTGVSIGVTVSDSQPTLRVGNADKPLETALKLKYLWFQSLLLKAYVWFKNTFIWPN